MYKLIAVACLVLFLILPAAAQEEAKSEKKELTDKMFALYRKGEFEPAIELGERLVKMEKKAGDAVSYVNALVNLARLKRVYYVALRNRLAGEKLPGAQVRAASEKIERHGNDAEELFREALALNEQNDRGKTAQTADIKKDLAWLVSNHSYTGQKTVEKSRSRIDEAEALLLDALAVSEQARGREAEETLLIALEAGDFYYKYVNFEKALGYYERFVKAVERRPGAVHPDLAGALRSYAGILHATFQDAEAAAVVKKIEALTGKTEPAGGAINLHLRSKDSVAYSAPIIAKANENAEMLRAKMRSGAFGSAELARTPRMIAVPVAVEVDETGAIVKATAATTDEKLKSEAEKTVAAWKVRPFFYNGTARKLRGTLIYRKL